MSQNIGIDPNFVSLSRLEADMMKNEENGGHFETVMAAILSISRVANKHIHITGCLDSPSRHVGLL